MKLVSLLVYMLDLSFEYLIYLSETDWEGN